MADKTLPPIAIGDSLADGIRTANNLEGNTRWGAGPKEVFEKIQEFAAKNSLAGRDVFIGTGMPNIPEQKKYVEQQIDFVRKQGGNPILIGVGPGTKSKPTTGQNEFLAGLAERKGLTYMGPLVNMFPDVTKDPMGLHLRAPQYKQLFKQFSQSQAQPQPQPKAQPQVQQVQPQSRESSAADLLAQFTGAVMQAESRGKRYDKSGKLLTSSKGAQGEMQVMPGTSTDPGFGVKPAKDNSPEEIARVGRDYAAVMLRRYNNNPTLAAVAYNWGPGNADRWIKGGADINKLPAETRNYVVRIAGNMGAPISVPTVAQPSPAPNKRADVRPVPPAKRVSTTTAPRAEAPVDYVPLGSTLDTAPRSAEQQNVVTRADMERLGPSYQAAFAAMSLADSRDYEDDYDDEDTIAERYMERRSEQLAEDDSTLEEEPTRTSSLADLDLTYQSPFGPEPEAEQPVRLAEGGDPAQEKDIDYKEYVREQLRKNPLYAGLGNGDRGSAKRELALLEISKDPRIALMLAGNAGELVRDPVTGAVMGTGVPAVMGRLGIDKNGARAGVSGAAVRLPDGSVKVFPGSADVGYSMPLYKGNLDVSADYGLGNLPRPMYGGRVRYEQSFKDGGVVYRADGSPIYGEGIDLSDSGGLTAQTRQNFFKGPKFNAREALSMLGQIGREGVSNLESTLRGSVAAIPGFVGDVESGFRDDKSRKYMTTEEVKRDVLPSRMTAPTAETAGFEELGTYLPLPVTPQQVLPPSVVRNLITKAKGMLPAKEVDTFPMGKLSAQEVLQQLKSFDPKELEKAKEAFLASSAEKRRMYHGTLMAPEGKTVVDKRLPDFYKTVGTDQGFTSFKPGTGGMTFVTPNPEFTDLFTGMRFAGKGNTSPSRVYPVYVQVKKPFDFENAKHVDELATEVSAAIRKNRNKKDLAWWMRSGGKAVSKDDLRKLLETGSWGFIEDPIVLESAKKLGFDGMYMLEAGTKNLGIFDPKKIKSATGNEGSFNVRDPDIRKAHGGIVHRAEGSPVYGEVADTGPITADTRAAFRNMRMPDVRDAREALKVLKGIARGGVSNLESVARGSVAGVPGIVGDIESIFRDDQARKFATSTEVERQYLPKRFTAPTKESQGFVEIGTAIDPSIALKAAPKTAKATLKALKESGPQVEAALMKVAPAAEPMYAVKPKGGVFFPPGFGSNVDNYLEDLADKVLRYNPNIRGKDAGRIRDLIMDKGRKYITTTYATGSDPIREAILEGRLTDIALGARGSEKLFSPKLIHNAREGSPEALKKFEELYDEATNIHGSIVFPTNVKDFNKTFKVSQLEKEKMLKEGVPKELQNTSFLERSLEDLKAPYTSEAHKTLAAFIEGQGTPVPAEVKSLLTAVRGKPFFGKSQEPIYDMFAYGPKMDILSPNIAGRGIASLDIKDIERMSFPEMIIRGAKNTLFERSQDAVIRALDSGKSVPSKFFMEGVSPVPQLKNTKWVSLDSPFATRIEGAAMRHSVGGYGIPGEYGAGGSEALLSGKVKIYSLRPEVNKPVVTVEARMLPDGPYIFDVRSKFNSVPTEEETKKIFELFDAIQPKTFGTKTYHSTREGKTITGDKPVRDWGEMYSNYLRYKNKGAE